MIRRPPRSTLSSSSAALDVYKRQGINAEYGIQDAVANADNAPLGTVTMFRLSVQSVDFRRDEPGTSGMCCGAKPKPRLVYEVWIESPQPFTVWRTYKEFAALNRKLKDEGLYVTGLPDKAEFQGVGDMETNAKRVKLLDMFIQKLRCGSAGSSEVFYDWLEMDQVAEEQNETQKQEQQAAALPTMGSAKMLKEEEPEARQKVEAIVRLPGNRTCVDCGSDYGGSTWVSCNLGCIFCMKCSGIHRSLGVHISFVKSVELDLWMCKDLVALEANGNEAINQEWMRRCDGPLREFLQSSKPCVWMDGNDAARTLYIRHKYDDALPLQDLLAELEGSGVNTRVSQHAQ
eukprot:TRINITY_DN15126_c0_g1_i5.p1 TRINITY_DN15126_c0_g1~~TRINITY_DN15126_c0_g1_i5.p1  ORF type:complete len:345 (+),score=48.29 TRINITY_DN15126_c0_g1_i5:123-1157(+)